MIFGDTDSISFSGHYQIPSGSNLSNRRCMFQHFNTRWRLDQSISEGDKYRGRDQIGCGPWIAAISIGTKPLVELMIQQANW